MDSSLLEIDLIYRFFFAHYPHIACQKPDHLEFVAESWLRAFEIKKASQEEFICVAKAAAEVSENIPRLQLLLVLLEMLRTNLNRGATA